MNNGKKGCWLKSHRTFSQRTELMEPDLKPIQVISLDEHLAYTNHSLLMTVRRVAEQACNNILTGSCRQDAT